MEVSLVHAREFQLAIDAAATAMGGTAPTVAGEATIEEADDADFQRWAANEGVCHSCLSSMAELYGSDIGPMTVDRDGEDRDQLIADTFLQGFRIAWHLAKLHGFSPTSGSVKAPEPGAYVNSKTGESLWLARFDTSSGKCYCEVETSPGRTIERVYEREFFETHFVTADSVVIGGEIS